MYFVPSVDPYFKDKNRLWFKKHAAKIRAAAPVHPWWRRNVKLLNVGQEISPGVLRRELTEMGYEKVQTPGSPGEFCVLGDILKIFLSTGDQVLVLDFFGNQLEAITTQAPPALHGARARRRQLEARLAQRMLKRLLPGDFVVHLDHGIGLFARHIKENKSNFYEIQYAKGDRILVPSDLATIKLSPFIGFGRPKIHRLGGQIWSKTKRAIKEGVEKFARDLLATYARRAVATRPPLIKEGVEFEKNIAATFPFELTPDQADAISDINEDLAKPEPMDRIVCGDVGFGKTEVALRTAAKVIYYGRQVALLAPTTILAAQHFKTFNERLTDMGVKVAWLSRATSPEQVAKITSGLAAGKIDLVVGTHRLLSNDVSFKNLGLLVIDEEQRFGVKQKEKLKEWRAAVDVLSLTATPIPRTLHLALAHIWQISNILTPPLGRKAIVTSVAPYDEKSIKAAISRELERGGQVYYLYNLVRGVDQKARHLRALFPKTKIMAAHARLPNDQLVKIIDDFRGGLFDILVATTIIENGLDVPNVNTLVVEKAEKLGLAQAHQIRGRVGRRETKAFAYFYYNAGALSETAARRLKYLERFQELGDGLELALKDLEIRGAGDVLGREQSGAVTAVGLNLYSTMLAEAVEQGRLDNK